MIKLNKMQGKIDSLLSVFTTLIAALENSIAELNAGVKENENSIVRLREQNATYLNKIADYTVLAENVKALVNSNSAEVSKQWKSN